MPLGSHPNTCKASEVVLPSPLGKGRASRSRTSAPRTPPAKPKAAIEKNSRAARDTRLNPDADKLAIAQVYGDWLKAGRLHDLSPIDDLMEKYGCSRVYPKRCYDKLQRQGSVQNDWCTDGRSPAMSSGAEDEMVSPLHAA